MIQLMECSKCMFKWVKILVAGSEPCVITSAWGFDPRASWTCQVLFSSEENINFFSNKMRFWEKNEGWVNVSLQLIITSICSIMVGPGHGLRVEKDGSSNALSNNRTNHMV